MRTEDRSALRIAYLGFDTLFPVLETAAAAGCTVLKVFTCPCDNVTEFNLRTVAWAGAHGVPVTEERITGRDLSELAAAGCELLLCAGYYWRVPLTDAFPMVNVHSAPLPACRGAWPMPQILLGAWPEGGVTVHKMAESFDTGDILLIRTFPVRKEDTLEDYMHQVDAILPRLVKKLLADLPGVLAGAVPQRGGRYLPMPTERDWTVTSGMTAAEADRILRAFFGYECLYEDGSSRYELVGARAFAAGQAPDLSPLLPLRDGVVAAVRVRRLSAEEKTDGKGTQDEK